MTYRNLLAMTCVFFVFAVGCAQNNLERKGSLSGSHSDPAVSNADNQKPNDGATSSQKSGGMSFSLATSIPGAVSFTVHLQNKDNAAIVYDMKGNYDASTPVKLDNILVGNYTLMVTVSDKDGKVIGSATSEVSIKDGVVAQAKLTADPAVTGALAISLDGGGGIAPGALLPMMGFSDSSGVRLWNSASDQISGDFAADVLQSSTGSNFYGQTSSSILLGRFADDKSMAFAEFVSLSRVIIRSAKDGSRIRSFDLSNIIPAPSSNSYDSFFSGFFSGDLNGDGIDDIVVQSFIGFYAIDGKTGQKIWATTMASSINNDVRMAACDAADMDGDGIIDVFCSVAVVVNGVFNEGHISVLNGKDGSEKQSENFLGETVSQMKVWPSKIAVGDFLGDGKKQIAYSYFAGSYQERVKIVDLSGKVVKDPVTTFASDGYSPWGYRVLGLKALDRNGDGKDELVAFYGESSSMIKIKTFDATGKEAAPMISLGQPAGGGMDAFFSTHFSVRNVK